MGEASRDLPVQSNEIRRFAIQYALERAEIDEDAERTPAAILAVAKTFETYMVNGTVPQ